MIGERQRRFVGAAEQQVARPLRAGHLLLAEAHDYACDMQCDLWDFAVEIDALRALRAVGTRTCAGWLPRLCRAATGSDASGAIASRRFRPARSFEFGENRVLW